MKIIRYGNYLLVIDTSFYLIFMVKLIQKTEVLKIQPGCNSIKSNEFVNLFRKKSVIINTGVPFQNEKKCTKRNRNQNKDEIQKFEANENADVKKNKETTVDFNYSSNNI